MARQLPSEIAHSTGHRRPGLWPSAWQFCPLQAVIWTGAAILSVLIVASRKHYTVDVLVAWYVVTLVFYASHRRWTTKRSLKEEWPHRPLPEEQPPELENVVVLTSAEVSWPPHALAELALHRVLSLA